MLRASSPRIVVSGLLASALVLPATPAAWAVSASSASVESAATSKFAVRELVVLDSGSGEGGAEIAAFDSATKQIVTTNGVAVSLDIYDASVPATSTRVARIDLTSFGDTVTSVAARGGVAVVAVPRASTFDSGTGMTTPRRGTAVVVDLRTLQVADTAELGFLPDGVTFTPDGRRVVIANEAQPECALNVPETEADESKDASLLVDPAGSVTILDVTDPANTQVSEVEFTGVRAASARLRGIVVRPGATAAQDFEPEFAAVSEDSKTAYISLQENNAIAVVDIAQARLVRVVSAGYTDRGDVPFDPSDRDSLRAASRTFAGVLGMRQPDGMAAFTVGGSQFVAAANEGDAREYSCLNDDVRAASLTVDAATFPEWATWKGNAQLGRLKVTNAAGDVDGDGDIDAVLARGSRSMTIYDTRGNEVSDTGAALEEWYATNANTLFNGQFNTSGGNVTWAADDRSDDKGPEPEGVAVGKVGGRTVAFLGLERTNGLALFDVTDPTSPSLDDVINFSDATYNGPASGVELWSPEGVVFVPASDSPTGRPLVITSFELSGSIAIHEVVERTAPLAPTGVSATYTGSGNVDITWSNPDALATGLPQIGSTVTCQAGTDTPLSTEVDGSATSATLTGLAFGLTYGCTVSARNDLGSTASAVTTVSALKTLQLLNFNDFHGRIDSNTVKFAGTIEQLRAQVGDERTALLSNGDSIGATLFASASAGDIPTIKVLNALGLAASSVGNHEFDAGFDNLTGAIDSEATFDYLGANVYLKGTTTPALKEYSIVTLDGVKVGVIGAVTADTPTLVRPSGVATLDFGDPVDAVNRVAAQLSDGSEANGEADVIVAEYHDGANLGSAESTLDALLANPGTFTRIVRDTSAEVDVIFNGHTHKVYAFDGPISGKTRPVVQAGEYGANVGQVVLAYNEGTREVSSYTARIVARTSTADADLTRDYPRVAAVSTIVSDALAAANLIGSQQVATVTSSITTAYIGDRRDDRASESTLGNLVADALLDSLKDPNVGGAEFGVVNPGGLRAELLYGDDGVITYAEANSVLPFLNNLWTTTLTGAQVKTMLEQQWQRDSQGNVPSRAFLRLGLSKNVSYTFDPARPEGDRITSIRINGVPVDPAKTYRAGSFSFLIQGGDNFRVFTSGTQARDSGLVDREAWIAYLTANSPLTPSFARRGVQVSGMPTAPLAPGATLPLTVSGLNLTSLGSPTTTTVSVSRGTQDLGSFAVTQGAVDLSFGITGAWVGDEPLVVTAPETGTRVEIPISVTSGTFEASPTPTISGNLRLGATLTAQPGSWSPTPDAYAYTWLRNGTPINGAQSATYVLGVADVGARIAVEVTATRSGYTSATVRSAETQVVGSGSITTVKPTVQGNARLGAQLSVVAGQWSPAQVVLAYQWLRNGTPISRAQGATYVLGVADVGARISVEVTGSAAGYTSATVRSDQTAAVAAGTLTAGTPTVQGTAKLNAQLTVVPGAWGPAPVALTYQWLREGAPISGATNTTYKLGAADLGKRISVRVTGTKVGYTSAIRTSTATGKVARRG